VWDTVLNVKMLFVQGYYENYFLFVLFLLSGLWLHETPRIPAGHVGYIGSVSIPAEVLVSTLSIGQRLPSHSVLQKTEKGGETKNA